MSEVVMDSSEDILLSSLENSGVLVPPGVTSIQTLTQIPDAFYSICARSVHQIDPSILTLNEEEDDDKFKTCTQLCDAIQNHLGYKKQISFHQLLYPSQEDVYNLLRFLVEKLSHSHKNQQDRNEPHIPASQIPQLETQTILLEIQKRGEECLKLSAQLDKRPKTASRKSYIHRISEITKNSRKQDADIQRILNDTRDLHIEANSIQDRLHRTYVVADETISRDMKKDPVRQHAFRLLTAIHENFGQISEKILVTDRVRREVVELEAKLAAVSTRNINFNMDKLQADLEAMRKENGLLEKQLSHQSVSPELSLPGGSVDL